MATPFEHRRFPVCVTVGIAFPDDYIVDGMDGLNVGHALWRAYDNWPSAVKITALRVTFREESR